MRRRRTVKTNDAPAQTSDGPISITGCHFGPKVDRSAVEALTLAVTRCAEANLETAKALSGICSGRWMPVTINGSCISIEHKDGPGFVGKAEYKP